MHYDRLKRGRPLEPKKYELMRSKLTEEQYAEIMRRDERGDFVYTTRTAAQLCGCSANYVSLLRNGKKAPTRFRDEAKAG